MAKVLICGGGNAAQVVCCLFSARHRTYALSLHEDHSGSEAEKWDAEVRANGGVLKVTFQGSTKTITAAPDKITKDPSCVKDCDIVLLTVPSSYHLQYLKALAPYASPGTIFVVMPARSGIDFLFRHVMGSKETAERRAQAKSAPCEASAFGLMAFETLPWACRIIKWGRESAVLGIKENTLAATIPPKGKEKYEVIQRVQGLLGVEPLIGACPNIMSISLANPGQVIHPGVTMGKWRDWDGRPLREKPLFYHGVDKYTAELLTGISNDIQAICKALQKMDKEYDVTKVVTVFDWYMDSYGKSIKDKTSLQKAMNTNEAYEGLTHPMIQDPEKGYTPDFKFRYLTEDVPTGLCFSKGVGSLLGVKTPTIDQVLLWCQEKMDKSYMNKKTGKMDGADVKSTRAPQAFGIDTKAKLIASLGYKPKGCFAGACATM